MKFELEALEKGSLEFQALNPYQQNQRLEFLSAELSAYLEGSTNKTFSKHTLFQIGSLLEYYLTRRIESVDLQPKLSTKPKTKRR